MRPTTYSMLGGSSPWLPPQFATRRSRAASIPYASFPVIIRMLGCYNSPSGFVAYPRLIDGWPLASARKRLIRHCLA
jgi:hypothetical protein